MNAEKVSNKKCGNNFTASLCVRWPVGIWDRQQRASQSNWWSQKPLKWQQNMQVGMPTNQEMPRTCRLQLLRAAFPSLSCSDSLVHLRPCSTCAEGESKAVAEGHGAGLVLHLPSHRSPGGRTGGWLLLHPASFPQSAGCPASGQSCYFCGFAVFSSSVPQLGLWGIAVVLS